MITELWLGPWSAVLQRNAQILVSLALQSTYGLMLFSLTACSPLSTLTSLKSFDYVSNRELREQYAGSAKLPSYWREGTELGAISLKSSSIPGDKHLFLIKRHKGRYSAETLMFESKEKRYFDRMFLSVGANYRDNSAGFQFRLEF